MTLRTAALCCAAHWRILALWCPLLILVTIVSCSGRSGKEEQRHDDAEFRRDLLLVRSQRIYFGHQSVGDHILMGVRNLVPGPDGLVVKHLSRGDESIPGGGVILDSHIGENGYPEQKSDDFARAVRKLDTASISLAMMKLCYADIDSGSDVRSILDYYVRTVEGLKKEYPHITFIHCTVPYVVRQPLWKRTVKSLLGMPNRQDIANAKRTRYNSMLREHYGDQLLFDLARVESTYPDGRTNEFTFENQKVDALIDEYSFDGAHLNELGGRLAAIELIRSIARAIRLTSVDSQFCPSEPNDMDHNRIQHGRHD